MMRQLSFFAYDTLCTVGAEVPANCDAERLLIGARDIALAVESTLNMYDPTSELSRLCSVYIPGADYCVSDMLFTFLESNLYLAKLTDGAFDPTIGPLVKLWDFLSDDPKVPDPEQMAQLLQHVGYQHISLDTERKTLLFDAPGLTIDPGASGKGFALGLVVDYLRKSGVTAATCNFGGNIFVIGEKQDDTCALKMPWKIAILNPDDRQNIIGTVELVDKGISTSSWYEHCFIKENKKFHHLLDTHTGMPKPLHLKSVSIISTNALFTDLLSTAFFMLGEEDGKYLLKRLSAESNEVIEYVAVLEDGSVSASLDSSFRAYA
jgi:FAD:protein FMN transferase